MKGNVINFTQQKFPINNSNILAAASTLCIISPKLGYNARHKMPDHNRVCVLIDIFFTNKLYISRHVFQYFNESHHDYGGILYEQASFYKRWIIIN